MGEDRSGHYHRPNASRTPNHFKRPDMPLVAKLTLEIGIALKGEHDQQERGLKVLMLDWKFERTQLVIKD